MQNFLSPVHPWPRQVPHDQEVREYPSDPNKIKHSFLVIRCKIPHLWSGLSDRPLRSFPSNWPNMTNITRLTGVTGLSVSAISPVSPFMTAITL